MPVDPTTTSVEEAQAEVTTPAAIEESEKVEEEASEKTTTSESEEEEQSHDSGNGWRNLFIGVVFLGCGVGILTWMKGVQWVCYKIGRRSQYRKVGSRDDDLEK